MNYFVDYTLYLADNTLILSQRNGEWCGHGPVLEQDIAITNISLDLIGQSRNFYQYAALIINESGINNVSPATEDTLAYLRKEREYKNCLLVEQPRGDWAQTILRQFLFSAYQYFLYEQLQYSKDAQLSAIAVKSLKEVTYHLRWSSEWVIRLGDGTDESKGKILHAVLELWPYTGELFIPAIFEQKVLEEGKGADLHILKTKWEEKVKEVFAEATLPFPSQVFMHTGGKEGVHTECMGFILTELQFMQKTYPNSEW